MPDKPRDEGLPAGMDILPPLCAHFHPAPPSVLTLDLDGHEGSLTLLPSPPPTPPWGPGPGCRGCVKSPTSVFPGAHSAEWVTGDRPHNTLRGGRLLVQVGSQPGRVSSVLDLKLY